MFDAHRALIRGSPQVVQEFGAEAMRRKNAR